MRKNGITCKAMSVLGREALSPMNKSACSEQGLYVNAFLANLFLTPHWKPFECKKLDLLKRLWYSWFVFCGFFTPHTPLVCPHPLLTAGWSLRKSLLLWKLLALGGTGRGKRKKDIGPGVPHGNTKTSFGWKQKTPGASGLITYKQDFRKAQSTSGLFSCLQNGEVSLNDVEDPLKFECLTMCSL